MIEEQSDVSLVTKNKKVDVSLDLSKNPKVRIDPIVLGKATITWERESGSPYFDFVSINYNPGGALSSKDVKAQKITVDNDTSHSGDHDYIITVRDESGDEYDSTYIDAPPTGDKPVIRN